MTNQTDRRKQSYKPINNKYSRWNDNGSVYQSKDERKADRRGADRRGITHNGLANNNPRVVCTFKNNRTATRRASK